MTGFEVWEQLLARGGLNIEKKRRSAVSLFESVASAMRGRRPYDLSLMEDLRAQLFPGRTTEFSELLKTHRTSPEALLSAFFDVIHPFSEMMGDILTMYARARATRNEQNLQILFNFDKARDPLRFSFRDFEEQVHQISSAVTRRKTRRWSLKACWDIERAISLGPGRPPPPRDEAVAEWVDSYLYNHQHHFPEIPPLPRSGRDDLDRLIADLERDLNEFLSIGRETFGGYEGLVSTPVDDREAYTGWTNALVVTAARDFWPGTVVNNLALLAEAAGVTSKGSDIDRKIKAISDVFAQIPTESSAIEQQLDHLLRILSLPTWKRRHEVFGVWICSEILQALAGTKVITHTHDNVLEFPFKPTHLATIVDETNFETAELWSEVRTAGLLLVGHGRKQSIQPDYRIRLAPITAPDPDRLIVECKQYQTSNTRNFSDAIIDYARNCPKARVVLCNYGPVEPAVLAAVPETLLPRSRAVGEVRPGGMGLKGFRTETRDALSDFLPRLKGPNWEFERAIVTLKWSSPGKDLDLWLIRGDRHTYYGEASGITGTRFHEDVQDSGSSGAAEAIEIAPDGTEEYAIWVNRYSGTATLADSNAVVTITLASGGKNAVFDAACLPGSGSWWHVGDLVPARDRFIERNRLTEVPPVRLDQRIGSPN
jgi:hypothetical protein